MLDSISSEGEQSVHSLRTFIIEGISSLEDSVDSVMAFYRLT